MGLFGKGRTVKKAKHKDAQGNDRPWYHSEPKQVEVPMPATCGLECSGGIVKRWRCTTCGYYGSHDSHPGCQKEHMKINDSRQRPPSVEDLKGKFDGRCNRSACLAPGAYWWNQSTRMYYCAKCADLINRANTKDALELYGTPNLCIKHKQEGVPE